MISLNQVTWQKLNWLDILVKEELILNRHVKKSPGRFDLIEYDFFFNNYNYVQLVKISSYKN